MCHSRSCHPTMTILQAPTPAPSTIPGPRRGSGPEIFTFDPLPEPAAAPAGRPSASRGHRKRSRRVSLPSSGEYRRSGHSRCALPWSHWGTTRLQSLDLTCLLFCLPLVRRQLPVEEPNPAKRLLFLLLTIVFCQILMAEEGVPAPLPPEDAPNAASLAPTPVSPVLEPFNLTSEPSDYALDLSTFLQQHPAAF
uniref:Anti-death protein n=2 Tax=Homo sapiens TaxID=9606 RepID=O75353_HUMAN|nr:anti-death protein [Homo sapiens]AAC72344.1 apoptosis inhibitor [Homo sapiens]